MHMNVLTQSSTQTTDYVQTDVHVIHLKYFRNNIFNDCVSWRDDALIMTNIWQILFSIPIKMFD